MKLKSVTLKGFGSFANEENYTFRDGVTYIVGRNEDRPKIADSNGAGKTTLFDGVSWGIYGRTPGGRKSNHIVSHNRDEAVIELVADNLFLERKKHSKRGEKLRWHKGDGLWIQGDLKETQKELTKYIGVSFPTFCNTLYLTRSSKTVRFLDAEPGDRAQVLAEFVNDDLYQRAGSLVLEDLRVAEAQETRCIILMKELQRQSDELHQDAIKIKEQLRQFTEKDNIRRQRVSRKMQALKERATIEHERVANPPDMDMNELQTNKVGLKGSILEKQKRIAILKEMLKSADHSLDAGVTCPTCRQELSEDAAVELHEFLDIAREEIGELEDGVINVEHAIREIDEEQEKLRNWRAIQVDVENNLKQIKFELELMKDDMLPSEASHLSGVLEDVKDKQRMSAERIQEVQEELNEVLEDMPYLKDLRKAFTTDIRNMLFDRIRGSLQYYTNMYLKMLAGNEFEIVFPSQSTTGKEKFEIVLRSGKDEQIIESYSEGETWRATFAILLALRRVLLEGNHCRAEWLFVDDPIGALDDTGAVAFNKVLQGLSNNGGIKQILCTVPRDSEWPVGSKVLTVTRRNRISTLEEK